MKLGVARVPTAAVQMSSPQFTTDLVRMVEDHGCESLWCVEHVLMPETYESRYPFDPSGKMPVSPDADMPDILVWLTYAASKSTSLRLGTSIMVLPIRNPAILAKQLATMHELSEGRLMIGVGAGWLEEEFVALGEPFNERGRRMDEYVELMQCLWRDAPASFHGNYFNFDKFYSCPRPGADGIPLFFGGTGRAACRRVATRGKGLILAESSVVENMARMLKEEADRAGRDFAELEITCPAPPTLEEARELQTLGVTRLLVPLFQDTIAECSSAIQTFQREILANLD